MTFDEYLDDEKIQELRVKMYLNNNTFFNKKNSE
jgi:hypothetical protein